jgi:hypothetical protein
VQLPNFTAEESIYHSTNHYRHTAGGSLLAHENGTFIPQGCGIFESIFCPVAVVAVGLTCTAICADALATAGASLAPCYVCVTAALGASYGACKDCLPAWIRDLINLFESGGGGEGGGGGGTLPQCCPDPNRSYCCPPNSCKALPHGGSTCTGTCVESARVCYGLP